MTGGLIFMDLIIRAGSLSVEESSVLSGAFYRRRPKNRSSAPRRRAL